MAATTMDHLSGGRFVLGLGAGWFEGEHEPFGIPLPPIGERIDRLISCVEVLRALFSPEAAAAPGVTRPDPFYPLAGAVNAPPPLTPGGPPIFLGGQKPRGIALAARRAAYPTLGGSASPFPWGTNYGPRRATFPGPPLPRPPVERDGRRVGRRRRHRSDHRLSAGMPQGCAGALPALPPSRIRSCLYPELHGSRRT